jgi:hypothetical protein
MIFESARPFHMGINFVVTPVYDIDRKRFLEFQQALLKAGVDADNAQFSEQGIIITRSKPTPLEVRISPVSPLQAQLAQLLIVAPNPSGLEAFVAEVEAVVKAFVSTWPARQRQLVKSDATIRYLYQASRDHAFKELWEERLGQTEGALAVFGKPVAGGGIRFVMPPAQGEQEPTAIEVKIESFLRDASQFFVEVLFSWSQPTTADFAPGRRLQQVEDFIEDKVHKFMEK